MKHGRPLPLVDTSSRRRRFSSQSFASSLSRLDPSGCELARVSALSTEVGVATESVGGRPSGVDLDGDGLRERIRARQERVMPGIKLDATGAGSDASALHLGGGR